MQVFGEGKGIACVGVDVICEFEGFGCGGAFYDEGVGGGGAGEVVVGVLIEAVCGEGEDVNGAEVGGADAAFDFEGGEVGGVIGAAEGVGGVVEIAGDEEAGGAEDAEVVVAVDAIVGGRC